MSPTIELLEQMIAVAGWANLALAVGSLGIPWLLGWQKELCQVQPLTRQVFWVYALYIWSSHISFGLLSVLAPAALINGTVLASAVASFIAVWWGARLLIQFCCLDRDCVPTKAVYRLGEVALVSTFVFLTVIYSLAAVANWQMVLR